MTGFDTHLIQRAKRGDQEALGAIYDCLYTSVFRSIYYRVFDPETTEDLAGDVFVRMVERSVSMSSVGALSWPGCMPSPVTW